MASQVVQNLEPRKTSHELALIDYKLFVMMTTTSTPMMVLLWWQGRGGGAGLMRDQEEAALPSLAVISLLIIRMHMLAGMRITSSLVDFPILIDKMVQA